MTALRVRIEEADLKDINPESDLYKRVQAQLAEADQGAPYLEYAKDRLHRDGELEFDDDAVVSTCDAGAYVLAWVWVDRDNVRVEGYVEEDE